MKIYTEKYTKIYPKINKYTEKSQKKFWKK